VRLGHKFSETGHGGFTLSHGRVLEVPAST
jgi:hypothetical protein